MTTPRRIYVACLASYNAGILHGRWVDADQDTNSIQDEVNAMLKASPEAGAEEWAIHDYEGFPDGTIQEYTGFQQVADLAAFLDEHDELGEAVLRYCLGDLDEAREAIEDNYAGEYSSLGEFAEEIETDAGTDVPDRLFRYIDWDAMGCDLELGGDVWTLDAGGSVHVFWSR